MSGMKRIKAEHLPLGVLAFSARYPHAVFLVWLENGGSFRPSIVFNTHVPHTVLQHQSSHTSALSLSPSCTDQTAKRSLSTLIFRFNCDNEDVP